MHKIHNVILIGTSHIAEQSVKEIKDIIETEKPDIVAVELDKNRLAGLLEKKQKSHTSLRAIRQIGVKGFMFAVIGSYIQKKLGNFVKVEPGADMLMAVKLAQKNKAKVALIDQNIAITLNKISKTFTFREFLKIFVDMFNGIFFKKKELKKYGLENLDLTKVPSKKVIKKVMLRLKERYPNIYQVLVHERNIVMARRLSALIIENPGKKIVAVVGAGHEDAIAQILEENTKITYSFSVNA